MRAYLAALVTAFAVFFTVGAAWAEGRSECVVNWAPQGSFAVESDLERAAQTFTKLGVAFWRAEPGQSRAPVVCADPNDPRCHIEQSEAPSRPHGLELVGGDGVTLPSVDLDVPPPESSRHAHAPRDPGGPREGHAFDLLRPPSR